MDFEFLSRIIVYPFIALLLAGVLFMHLGLRSRSSFASLLSLALLTAWATLSHWVFHLFFIGNGDPTFERMGSYSAHPHFDTINTIVFPTLSALFCFSFFLTAISIAANNTTRVHPLFKTSALGGLTRRTLWTSAALFMALSSLSTIWYRHIGLINGNLAHAVIAATIALVGLTCAVLLVGIAIYRRAAESRSA